MTIDVPALRVHYRELLSELQGAPPEGEFSLSVQASQTLLEVLRRRRARGVLELGSGFSTLLLRTWARDAPVQMLTLEHDGAWRTLMRKLLKGEGLYSDRIWSTGVLDLARAGGPWDCILVDHGPTMQTRLDDLERLVTMLARGGAMVLDDFRRRTSYAADATRILERLGLEVAVAPRSQSGDRALGVAYFPHGG